MLLACTCVLLLILRILLLLLYISLEEGRAAIENNFDISPYSSIAWLLLQICWVFSSDIPSTALCKNAVDAKRWLHV